MEGGWFTARPGRFTPEKETLYLLYRRLGEPQGRCGRVGKISPPPRFKHRTVQPVASHYIDYAIPLFFRKVENKCWRFNPAELLTIYDVYVDAGGICDSWDAGVVAGIWRSCLGDVKSWRQLVSPLDIDTNSWLWLSGGRLFRENYGLLDDSCPSVPEHCP
jgi:hypothetical protein